jgi:hypothetical protein
MINDSRAHSVWRAQAEDLLQQTRWANTMKLLKLGIGAVAAAALLPLGAHAQPYGYQRDHSYQYNQARPYDYSRGYQADRLRERTERVRSWIRTGTDEGWLRGWQARRAWQELRTIRELATGYEDRREAWQRLNALTEFLRDAREDAY